MVTPINHETQSQLGHKAAIANQHLRAAEHKDDDKKQVPVEHQQASHLNAILLALMAMQDSRHVDELNAQQESNAVSALSNQMNDLNTQLAGMNNYESIKDGLKGDALTEAIAQVQADNSMVDARRSIVEGEYGNDKLLVQQKQSTIGADINSVVQQLQQSAGLLNQVAQLSNVVAGR